MDNWGSGRAGTPANIRINIEVNMHCERKKVLLCHSRFDLASENKVLRLVVYLVLTQKSSIYGDTLLHIVIAIKAMRAYAGYLKFKQLTVTPAAIIKFVFISFELERKEKTPPERNFVSVCLMFYCELWLHVVFRLLISFIVIVAVEQKLYSRVT